MQQQTTTQAWWAEGDQPARDGCHVEPLIDGRAAMFALCRAFLGAKDYIVLAGWDIRADLPMVRGGDARLGDEDSHAQQRLIESLRSEGLDEDAIALWNSGNLRVADVLGFAVRKGVRVGVLLWDAMNLGEHITNDPTAECEALTAVGVDCLLDDSSRRITHFAQSLHQKCAVIDGRVAFVGGVDLTVQTGGDYDRWDTHQHPCSSKERIASRSAACHPWHDVHTRIEGPVVADVLHNLAQRWRDVAARHDAPTWPAELPPTPPAPIAGGITAQVVRTIPPNTYDFAPKGIGSIKDLYVHAIDQAQHFIYLENQYLWPEVFVGLDRLRWGTNSTEIMQVIDALGRALERGVRVAIALPDHPNCGRRFTDGGVKLLREHASKAGTADALSVFTLGNSEVDETQPYNVFYRPVYVHAKVAIVDDHFWTCGSANLNSRGMHSDAEINVGVLDDVTARTLRMRLWAEHLRRTDGDFDSLDDPVSGLGVLRAAAAANREHVRQRELLVGHILPYLTEQDGVDAGLEVHGEHGWLDNIEGGAGGLPAKYADRYV